MRYLKLVVAVFLSLAGTAWAGDIDAFWRDTLARLAREPMDATVEPVKEPMPYKSFKVTLRGLGGVHFVARLAVPVQGEAPARPWPVIVTAPGYSGTALSIVPGECQRGYAILQVYPRSQGESADLWKIDGPDKLTWHLDHPEGAYYQGAYADVIRAIDFAVLRDDLDHDRIAMVGTSQAGGIVLAVAALDPRVKAVVAHVPFLCDMRMAAGAPDILVKTLLERAGRNDEQALSTLDYFDPCKLASNVQVPVLISAGGKDTTCPQATIQSLYDHLPGKEKTLRVYPNLTHTSCVDFYNLSWTWLDENFRHPESSHAASSQPATP